MGLCFFQGFNSLPLLPTWSKGVLIMRLKTSSTTTLMQTSMNQSQTKHDFKAVKEFHVITLQAFIDVCLPLDFVVADLNCGTSNCIFFYLYFLFQVYHAM
jgi:hypothetical protein